MFKNAILINSWDFKVWSSNRVGNPEIRSCDRNLQAIAILIYTLSVQKLGMVLAQIISEFLIFRKGPVMEVLKIPNFLERLGQKFEFLMKISIFTYRFIEFISNPVYIFNCKWVALLWPSYHDAEVERINFWRHLMAKIENPFCLWPIYLWVDYLNSGRR